MEEVTGSLYFYKNLNDMGLFNFFRKKSAKEQFREKVRDAFEASVKNTIPKLTGDKFMDGLLIQAAIGSVRTSLLDQPELQIIGLAASDWTLEQVIDEECNRVLNKYLVR